MFDPEENLKAGENKEMKLFVQVCTSKPEKDSSADKDQED